MATRSVRLGRLFLHAASARRLEMEFRQSHSRALSMANSTLPLPSGEVARVAAYPSETSAHTLTEQQLEFRTLAQVQSCFGYSGVTQSSLLDSIKSLKSMDIIHRSLVFCVPSAVVSQK